MAQEVKGGRRRCEFALNFKDAREEEAASRFGW